LTDLVIDTSALSPFARSRRLHSLEFLTRGLRRVTTTLVREEIEQGIEDHPELIDVSRARWLFTVDLGEPAMLMRFAEFTRVLVDKSGRNAGEASVLAYALVTGCPALVDDRTACDVGKQRGVGVRRSLALIAGGIRNGSLAEHDGRELVDDLIAGGARFPCSADGFIAWCCQCGFL
jgi:predicted nucleic acid-binding protein